MSRSVDRAGPAMGERAGGDAVIGVNLTWLVPGVVGGSEEYTVRLLEAIGPALAPGCRLRLYGRPDLAEAYPELATAHQWVEAPVWPGGRLTRVTQEATWLARQTRTDALVHHAGGTIPLRGSRPAVVTVHDLQPIEHPDNFGLVKRWWLGRSIPRAVERAELVLCPSPHAAGRLEAVLDVAPERIRVVPHGHRPPPEPDEEDDDRRAAMADRFGRFLLYPAIAYRHKRHVDLVHLLDQLGPQHGDVQVVLTGRPGPESEAVRAEAERLGVGDRVHQLGRVPLADLHALYRAAEALVFPSAYEGFGNPAVEAMGLGCPVVVSDAGALPDVVGPAGLIFAVGDVAAMAEAVALVLDDPDYADGLRQLGRLRAAEFDVEMAAARLADVYREIVDSPRS
ncbi:MAG: glycosyltransferase family 1 protein [Actinomycetota bacterium]